MTVEEKLIKAGVKKELVEELKIEIIKKEVDKLREFFKLVKE